MFDILVVWDEIQDHLKTPVDSVVLWWFTYHRHLNHQIHLLTQDLTQIPKEYLKNGTFFYKMPSPAMALFKNRFTVSYYSCLGMTQKCRDKSFTIPFLPKVGELYTSGDRTERKPILKKFLMIFPMMIAFLFLAFWYFNVSREEATLESSGRTKQDKQEVKEVKEVKEDGYINESNSINNTGDNSDDNKRNESKDFDLENQKLIKIKCLNDICKYNNKSFPIDFLLFMIEKNTFSYSNVNKISYQYTEYTFLFDQKVITFFNSSFSSTTKRKRNSPPTQNISLFGN